MSRSMGSVRTFGSVESGTTMVSPASTLYTLGKLETVLPSGFKTYNWSRSASRVAPPARPM